MIYKILADLVVVSHLVFILFALLGGLLALWNRWAVLLHLPAAIWIAWIEFSGGICPLTPLENRLRILSGVAGYEGGFIEFYVLPIIYPENLTRDIQIWLGISAIIVNLIIYGIVLYQIRRRV